MCEGVGPRLGGKRKESGSGSGKGRGKEKGREMKQGTGGEVLNGQRKKVAWLIDLRKHNECQKVAVFMYMVHTRQRPNPYGRLPDPN